MSFPLVVRSCCFALSCALGASAQTTWFVDDDGIAGPGTYEEPFCTIQAGIDAASDGDMVLVRPGTYFETIDFLGKAILVRSAEGPQATILDGGWQFFPDPLVAFRSREGPDSVLEGLTIDRSGVRPAVHCDGASPTIRGNVITRSIANNEGAAIRCENGANARILDNEIRDNVSQPGGGRGGGIYGFLSTLTITGNRIVRNACFGDPVGEGAGIYLFFCNATLANNLIAKNDARDYGGSTGGGILIDNSIVTLDSSTIADNIATSGIYVEGQGGGLAVYGASSQVWITNTIFWDNVSENGSQIYVDRGVVGVLYSDVEQGPLSTYANAGTLALGDGNLSKLPLFSDPASDDYRLLPSSPLIDLGFPPEPAGGTDPDRDPRLLDGNGDGLARIDMGADEHNRTMLTATGDASLGGTLTFTTLAAAPNSTYVLLTAEKAGDRAFGAYGSLLLELASLTVVSIAVAPDSDDVQLPPDLSLAGRDLHAQSLAVELKGIAGSFSNRLSFVLH